MDWVSLFCFSFFVLFFLLSSKMVKWYSYISLVPYSKKKIYIYIYIRMWYDIYIYIYIYTYVSYNSECKLNSWRETSVGYTASERNSVVVGSNPTQTNILELLQQIFQWWTPYIYQFIPLHLCDYLNKIAIKLNVATYEGNSQNEIWRWTNDEIGIAVTNWLWVPVELMAW